MRDLNVAARSQIPILPSQRHPFPWLSPVSSLALSGRPLALVAKLVLTAAISSGATANALYQSVQPYASPTGSRPALRVRWGVRLVYPTTAGRTLRTTTAQAVTVTNNGHTTLGFIEITAAAHIHGSNAASPDLYLRIDRCTQRWRVTVHGMLCPGRIHKLAPWTRTGFKPRTIAHTTALPPGRSSHLRITILLSSLSPTLARIRFTFTTAQAHR